MDKKIISFQCDGEFTESVFKQFIDSCGLSLRLSCPRTPQKTGSRTIGTLAKWGSLSFFFLLEALSTALSLIQSKAP